MIRSLNGRYLRFDQLVLSRKDEQQRIRLAMGTRQRFKFHGHYSFASVDVDIDLMHEKIQGHCKACGCVEHVVEGCDQLFVKVNTALHGLSIKVIK